LKTMDRYFQPFFATIPFWMRRFFKNRKITYVLSNGTETTYFSVDVYGKKVTGLKKIDDANNPIQIHVPTFVMRHCLAMKLFSHLPISKRVVYRTYTQHKKVLVFYGLLFNLYEYELMPLKQLFSKRVLEAICYRWREGVLYLKLLAHIAMKKKIELKRHLPICPSKVKANFE
jgi:UDP-MurNAc hydroxylase